METTGNKNSYINTSQIALVIAILALGLSFFNVYQLQQGGGAPVQAKGESPEKILKELPENAPVLGDMEAKVTIVEFADYQCPFCGRFFKEIYPALKEKYIDTGKVKFVYLDYAFLGQESKDAAEAAKCAAEQNKFWQYHDELYSNQKGENQGAFNKTILRKLASNIGLNLNTFDSCVSDTRYDKAIEDERVLAGKYGVSSTPNFLIGKELVRGAVPLTQFEEAIEKALK